VRGENHARLKVLVAGFVALFSMPTWAGVHGNIGTNIENALRALQSGAAGGMIALVTGGAIKSGGCQSDITPPFAGFPRLA
jgi:hypothetical protein